ncbi:hypothetical protein A2U01_0035151, partial [Trifolium medium]|nr:hypothetical protein [Trifolium medium]
TAVRDAVVFSDGCGVSAPDVVVLDLASLVSLYLLDLYRVGVDRLEAVCKLKLICLGSHSTGDPSTFDSRNCFLDSDGPITFDSRSGVSI